ncbi:hypothetical protein TNIN_328511 [Trichonephila inaurata madagascariensis]|uniref:DUF5641 domain-containing protein n=1 Tax=Trichonephila inaurata madagascariensis TaxID=2747483 RepID=A0A8X7CI09_9ARAC|nr:hypothetical protein TNIN_328511 [Trichonephila inaurata madagascariensis]
MCGTVVIIKEDFTPVCNCLLGHVVEVYHGSDGKMRTVRIKAKTGEIDNKVKAYICMLTIQKPSIQADYEKEPLNPNFPCHEGVVHMRASILRMLQSV